MADQLDFWPWWLSKHRKHIFMCPKCLQNGGKVMRHDRAKLWNDFSNFLFSLSLSLAISGTLSQSKGKKSILFVYIFVSFLISKQKVMSLAQAQWVQTKTLGVFIVMLRIQRKWRKLCDVTMLYWGCFFLFLFSLFLFLKSTCTF